MPVFWQVKNELSKLLPCIGLGRFPPRHVGGGWGIVGERGNRSSGTPSAAGGGVLVLRKHDQDDHSALSPCPGWQMLVSIMSSASPWAATTLCRSSTVICHLASGTFFCTCSRDFVGCPVAAGRRHWSNSSACWPYRKQLVKPPIRSIEGCWMLTFQNAKSSREKFET